MDDNTNCICQNEGELAIFILFSRILKSNKHQDFEVKIKHQKAFNRNMEEAYYTISKKKPARFKMCSNVG